MAGPWEKYKQFEQKEAASGPWAKYATSSDEAEGAPKTGALEAMGEHAANAASLGYLPQIQAMATKPIYKVLDKIHGQNLADTLPSYGQLRDEEIDRLELQKKEHPVAAGVGTGAGALGSAVVAGALTPIKGATLGARAVQAGKAGATLGAIANPGDTKGEIDPLQFGKRADNAIAGGALGVVAQPLAEGAGYAAGKAGEYLKNRAAKAATRALGRPTPTQAREMAKSGMDVQLGNELLDSRSVPWLGTRGRIAKRVDAKLEEVGEKIGELIDSAGTGKVIDPTEIGVKLLDDPELALLRKTPGAEGTVAQIEQAAETLANAGPMTMKEAHSLRRMIDKQIKDFKRAPDAAGKVKAAYEARTGIRDEMNKAVNEMNPGAGKDALLKENLKYGRLAKADDILDREAGALQANQKISLTDVIAATGGAGFGNDFGDKAKYAAAFALLNKGRRAVGASVSARVQQALANQLLRVPRYAQIAEKDPQGFSSLVERVASQMRSSPSPQLAQEADRSVAESKPTKGEAAWIQRGADNLGLSPEQMNQIAKSPKGKRLLIEASDLSPNSKASRRIKEQLQKGQVK